MIEGIRLLETLVTAPLGLYSDLKMLRESLPYSEAADLTREQTAARRGAYAGLTDRPSGLALAAISSVRASIGVLEVVPDDPDVARLRAGWIEQARRVLDRAERKVRSDRCAE